MATPAYSTDFYKKMQRYWTQRQIATGRPPTQEEMQAAMEAGLREAGIATEGLRREKTQEDQFSRSLEQQRYLQEQQIEANKPSATQTAISSLGTLGSLALGYSSLKNSGLIGGKAAGTTGGAPSSVSITSQTPAQIQASGGNYGTTAGTNVAQNAMTGASVYGPSNAIPAGSSYVVTPASYEGMTFTAGAGGGYAGEGATAGLTAAEAGGSTVGSVAGGIVGGIGTAIPYYGLAKAGGSLGKSITEGKGGSVPQYWREFSETLEKPLQVEQYAVQEKLGVNNPVINGILNVLNPAGYVVNKLEESAGTVICTELHRQGLMDDETYKADAIFGSKQDFEVIAGYHTWGIPLATAMRNSRFITCIVKPLALAWAEDMAGKQNKLGRFLNTIGIPICRFIGRIKRGMAWQN